MFSSVGARSLHSQSSHVRTSRTSETGLFQCRATPAQECRQHWHTAGGPCATSDVPEFARSVDCSWLVGKLLTFAESVKPEFAASCKCESCADPSRPVHQDDAAEILKVRLFFFHVPLRLSDLTSCWMRGFQGPLP